MHNTTATPPKSDQPQPARTQFVLKLKAFLRDHIHGSQQMVRVGRGGFAFTLSQPQAHSHVLDQLVEQTFGCNAQEFTRLANRFGLTIRNMGRQRAGAKVTLFLSKQQLVETSKEEELQGLDWEEQEEEQEDDEFPQQEEIEAVLREKEQREQQREQRERQREQKEQKEQQREPKEQQREQKVKSPFIKPTIILNKVLSEGNMGLMEAKKEDASIEVKLHEQELPPTSQQRQAIKSDSVAARLEEACPLSLADRIRIEKENYEKCSRLIDGTIIDLLEAHRGRRVAARRQDLMEKVVQIYDLLSNGVENSGSVVRVTREREQLRGEEREED